MMSSHTSMLLLVVVVALSMLASHGVTSVSATRVVKRAAKARATVMGYPVQHPHDDDDDDDAAQVEEDDSSSDEPFPTADDDDDDDDDSRKRAAEGVEAAHVPHHHHHSHDDDDDDDDGDDDDDDDDDSAHVYDYSPTDLFVDENDKNNIVQSFGGQCSVSLSGRPVGPVPGDAFPASFLRNVKFIGAPVGTPLEGNTNNDAYSALCPMSEDTLEWVESGESYSLIQFEGDGVGVFVLQFEHPVTQARVTVGDTFNGDAGTTFGVSRKGKLVEYTTHGDAMSDATTGRKTFTLVVSEGAFDEIAISITSGSSGDDEAMGGQGCLIDVSVPCSQLWKDAKHDDDDDDAMVHDDDDDDDDE